MIKEARRDDKGVVYELWKQAYPSSEQKYLNFYFRNYYDKGKTLVQCQDHRIVSSLAMNSHVLQFHGKLLNVSYILGISTLPDYRRRGHMKELLDQAIDEASHNHLITLVKAFNPKLYEPFGFSVVYERKNYLIHHESLDGIQETTFTKEVATAKELLAIYEQFTRLFDGYYKRDEAYYEILLKELELKEKHLIVYQKPDEPIKGYMIYQIKKNDFVIQEAVYLDSIVLQRMMKNCIGDFDAINIEVSQSEKLEKIFPLANPRRKNFMMARINNFDLFNKLYNTNVKSVEEAYQIIKKPLWLHEYY